WAALIAALLGAVQLLPALEAARESSRDAGVGSGDIFVAALPALAGLVGPGLTSTWEDRGGLGVLWIAAALTAALLCRSRARFEGIVCLIVIVFGLGGAALVQSLPGFRLFQLPVRMLMFLGLPVAILTGRLTQILMTNDGQRTLTRSVYRRVLLQTV